MYKFGTIVLIPFPFTDLTSQKVRPALIVSKTNKGCDDVILTFITSQTREHTNAPDFLLESRHKHFKKTGLKVDSVFKFGKIATLSKKLILGEIGLAEKDLLKEMKGSFEAAFGF